MNQNRDDNQADLEDTCKAEYEYNCICLQCGVLLYIPTKNKLCPHCGLRTEAKIDPRAIDPGTLTVVLDLPCSKCSYNIRTLHIESRCPECGTPVSKSIRTEALQFSSLDWLKTVRAGVSMLLAVAIGILVCAPVTAIAVSLNIEIILLTLAIMFVTFMLFLMGVVNVATLEDKHNMTFRQRVPNWLALAAIPAFFIPLMIVPAGLSGAVLAVEVLASLFFASLFACFLSLAICMTRLAKRNSKQTLARNTACTFWVLSLTVLLAYICTILDQTVLPISPQTYYVLLFSLGMLFTIAYIAAIVILVQHRRMLTKAIRSREAMDDAVQADRNIDTPSDNGTADHTESNLVQD